MIREHITDRAHGIDVSHIYALVDPRSGNIRYVGKAKNVQKRFWAHIDRAKKCQKTHRDSWIRGLLLAGLQPTILICDTVPDSAWQEYERLWIGALRCSFGLTNQTDGGEGGAYTGPRSKEWNEHIAASKRGKPLSPEHRAKCATWKGKKQTKEMCLHKSMSMLGKNCKVAQAGLISPDGEEFPHIKNLREFAHSRGLSQAHLHQVTTGKRMSHKGWRCLPNGA